MPSRSLRRRPLLVTKPSYERGTRRAIYQKGGCRLQSDPNSEDAAPQRSGRGGWRSSERSFERSYRTHTTSDSNRITIPATRRKTRQSFDIFEDQYDALKKLQLAEADQAEDKHGRKMGDMVQEALDSFIKEKAKKLETISIQREHE
jgi:hypothetical protein